MLVLTRKIGERVLVGDEIEVTILNVKGSKVTLGFQGPEDIHIIRSELQGNPPMPPDALVPVK